MRATIASLLVLLAALLLAPVGRAGDPPAAEDPGAADAPEEATAEAADPDYAAGVVALRDKDAARARAAFDRCLAKHPDGPVAEECHWEAGWAAWVQGDWGAVVDHWEAVKRVDPDREGLAGYLAQARDNLGLADLLARGREAAPATFHSDVPAGTTLRVRAVGDLMIGSAFPEGSLPPDDARGAFADVADWLRDADLTFGNLEGPLCDGGTWSSCRPDAPPGRCYAFRSPERYAPLYAEAGFDVLNTANNHAGDFGPTCRARTEALLDGLGIAHTGRPGDIAELEVHGLRVAVIGFHTSRSGHYLNDHEEARALVRALAADHDIVIVSFHGGAEGARHLHVPEGPEMFYGENRGDLRAFTHAVVDAGADLVLGHGPHVLRGMEVYRDRLIAYSLGNFATYGRFNLSGNLGVGAVLDVTLDAEGRFVTGRILPTRQEGEGLVRKDPEGRAIDLVRTLSAEDFPDTGVEVARDGTLARR